MIKLRNIRLLLRQLVDPALVGSGNFVSNILGAIFWLYFASILRAQEYGQVNYSIALASIASTASIVGANTTVTTYFAKGDEAILRQANALVLLLSAIAAVIVALLFGIYASVLLLGLSAFSMTIAEILGQKQYKRFSLVMIINRGSQIAFSLILYYLIGLDGIILGYAIPSLVLGFRIFHLNRSSLSFSEIRSKSKFMIHAYSLTLSQAVVAYADKLVIASFFSFAILGLYQLGFQFLMFLTVIPASLYQYLLPNEASGVERKTVRKVGLLLSISLAIIFYFASPYVISSLFPKYMNAIPAAQLMAFGIIPLTMNSIMNSRFFGIEKTRPVIIGAGGYAGALVFLLFILGNIFGVMGLAGAVVISLALQSLILWVFTKFSK